MKTRMIKKTAVALSVLLLLGIASAGFLQKENAIMEDAAIRAE